MTQAAALAEGFDPRLYAVESVHHIEGSPGAPRGAPAPSDRASEGFLRFPEQRRCAAGVRYVPLCDLMWPRACPPLIRRTGLRHAPDLRRHHARSHARQWAACAVAVALAATACGGGAGPSRSGVVSSSWGDPQNPLEPANTNEVQGGKVLDMLFRGLKRYDPKTGEAEDMLAEKIETTDSQNFTVTIKDGWTFSNGEKVTAKSFVDAWNYGAAAQEQAEERLLLRVHRRLRQGPPGRRAAHAPRPCPGCEVDGRPRPSPSSSPRSSPPGPTPSATPAFAPLPQAFFDDHDAWLDKPVGNGPYTVDSYTKGSVMSCAKWDEYPGDDKAQNGGVDLKVYTDNNTAYTDLTRPATSTSSTTSRPRSSRTSRRTSATGTSTSPAGIIQTLAFPFYDKAWNTAGREKVRQRPLHGDQPRRRSPSRSSRRPAPPPPTGPRRSSATDGRLQGGAVRRRLRVRPGRGARS